MGERSFASGLLLVLIGLWLLLQTLVGDLPRRVLSHAGAVDTDPGPAGSVAGLLLSPVSTLAKAFS